MADWVGRSRLAARIGAAENLPVRIPPPRPTGCRLRPVAAAVGSLVPMRGVRPNSPHQMTVSSYSPAVNQVGDESGRA